MHDKILAMVLATLAHENTFEKIEVALSVGEVRLTLSQPDEKSSWPDHELVLTFQGVRKFLVRSLDEEASTGEILLGMDCEIVGESYRAEISVGNPGEPKWCLELTFGDLRYRRS